MATKYLNMHGFYKSRIGSHISFITPNGSTDKNTITYALSNGDVSDNLG